MFRQGSYLVLRVRFLKGKNKNRPSLKHVEHEVQTTRPAQSDWMLHSIVKRHSWFTVHTHACTHMLYVRMRTHTLSAIVMADAGTFAPLASLKLTSGDALPWYLITCVAVELSKRRKFS